MTKREFLMSVPDIIEHKSSGYGEIEVIMDTTDKKGACYRHRDKTASFGTYATTWEELYVKFSNNLISKGYMKAK